MHTKVLTEVASRVCDSAFVKMTMWDIEDGKKFFLLLFHQEVASMPHLLHWAHFCDLLDR